MSGTTWSRQDVERAIAEIAKRSSGDAEFRKRTLENPGAVIAEVSGKALPPGYAIEIIESRPGIDWTYVLPPPRDGELSDEELDKAAGGRDCRPGCPVAPVH
mgnify:CR=1 FL=1